MIGEFFGETLGEIVVNTAKLVTTAALAGAGAAAGVYGARRAAEYFELMPKQKSFDLESFQEAIAARAAAIMEEKVKDKMSAAMDSAATAVGAKAAAQLPAPTPTPASGGLADQAALMRLVGELAAQLKTIKKDTADAAADAKEARAAADAAAAAVRTPSPSPAPVPAPQTQRPAPHRSASANPRLEPAGT